MSSTQDSLRVTKPERTPIKMEIPWSYKTAEAAYAAGLLPASKITKAHLKREGISLPLKTLKRLIAADIIEWAGYREIGEYELIKYYRLSNIREQLATLDFDKARDDLEYKERTYLFPNAVRIQWKKLTSRTGAFLKHQYGIAMGDWFYFADGTKKKQLINEIADLEPITVPPELTDLYLTLLDKHCYTTWV